MMLGARTAAWSGKRLPYDAEVEYLESARTQWIDTLVEPAQNLAFSCTFVFEGVTPELGYGNIFGSRYSSAERQYQLTGYESGSVLVGVRNSNLGFYSGVINTVSFDGANTVNINGVSRSITTSTCSPTTGNIVLFGIRQNGSVTQTSNSKIFSLKFIQNGTLVRDYIPVRKGTVGYFYDRVSGKLFGNAGTGDFVLGPDVVPVEYLQSSGTQYIDTGVVGYKTTKVESHCALLNANSAYPAMWGARTGSRNNDFQIYYNTPTIGGNPSSIVLRTGNSDKSISTSDIGVNTFIGTRLDIVAADGALSVNGYNFSTPAFSNFTTPHSILMFCEYAAIRPANFGSFVYWGMKMWQADSIVRSFLPVRVGTEGAMMDTLTRRIYRNAGTGAFIIGPDKTT